MTTTRWYHRFTPRTLAGRRNLVGYVFISPFILGFLLWFLIPALVAMWLTVHEWSPDLAARVCRLQELRAHVERPAFLEVTAGDDHLR